MEEFSDDSFCDIYEESRQYPRIKFKMPVNLIFKNERKFSADIYDISSDGLQIRCGWDVAEYINPDGEDINLKEDIIVKTIFSLPINDEQKEIRVDCNVKYIVLLNDKSDGDIVAIGLNFKKFEDKSIKFIGRYILQELEPTSNNID